MSFAPKADRVELTNKVDTRRESDIGDIKLASSQEVGGQVMDELRRELGQPTGPAKLLPGYDAPRDIQEQPREESGSGHSSPSPREGSRD